MPASRELVQVVKVKGHEPQIKGGFTPILNDISAKIKQGLPKAVSQINKDVQKEAKQSQIRGINELRAVECGNLRGSINVLSSSEGGLSATSEIGTSINEKYPLFLIKGHGEIRPINAKALFFRKRCGKGKIFAARSKPAPPKDYMKRADGSLKGKIPGIVERDCINAFGI